MNFDLFDDPPIAAPARDPHMDGMLPPPAAAAPPSPPTGAILMQPSGLNRWKYRGIEIGCNMKLQGMVGHWFTIEPLGREVRKHDMRTGLCRAIDEHLAAGGAP